MQTPRIAAVPALHPCWASGAHHDHGEFSRVSAASVLVQVLYASLRLRAGQRAECGLSVAVSSAALLYAILSSAGA
jgi:hypothetical protein